LFNIISPPQGSWFEPAAKEKYAKRHTSFTHVACFWFPWPPKEFLTHIKVMSSQLSSVC